MLIEATLLDEKLLLDAMRALKGGDFDVRLPAEWTGVPGKIADTFNEFAEMNARILKNVEILGDAVGKQGKVTQRVDTANVSGAWRLLLGSLNTLVDDLVQPTNEVARVIGAVAKGDLSQGMALDVDGRMIEGQYLLTAKVVNAMVEQLNGFVSEVSRVAREVGSEGKLGGQAQVKGSAGTWKDLTEGVNTMVGNLTVQLRDVSKVATAIAKGDLSQKITVDAKGEILELKSTINSMVDQLTGFAGEVTRVTREVGSEGKLGGQAIVKNVAGTWNELTDNVNTMVANLTVQLRDVSKVATAISKGDLSQKITVDVKGEILDLKSTINMMVDQLSGFSSEVSRLAREVGMDGKLGGQAVVKGVAGTWKDLTDNVNLMASNLTSQVRGIARVVSAIATGDLKKKLTVDAKGEIAELAGTINNMIDTLATFSDQVTGVARDVGVEGKLGGQANVPGASGTWNYITENVNLLAANLTTQVRAIAEVATAVTTGDLTRSIRVEAMGEVAALKDNINEMIRNLKETTEKNTEQDWLKTNLASFSRKLQGQRDMVTVCKMLLTELSPLVNAQHGVLYTLDATVTPSILTMRASYGFKERKGVSTQFRLGEGLVGECALEKERILLTEVPADYIQISSALGHATPLNVVVLPVIFEGAVKAVMELASFSRFTPTHLTFLEQLTESFGIFLNTIEADSLTASLLQQSQVDVQGTADAARGTAEKRMKSLAEKPNCWPIKTFKSNGRMRKSKPRIAR